MTTMLPDFDPKAEVTADSRARIAFGKIGVNSNERYLVSVSSAGEILLTPVTSIPKRELLIWENEQVRESVRRGLMEAHLGKAVSRDDLLEGDDD